MKIRRIIINIVICMIIILASCNKSTQNEEELSLYDSTNKTYYCFNETADSINSKVNQELKYKNKSYANYEGAELFFRDNVCKGYCIGAYQNENNRFQTVRKIALYSDINSIKNEYGEPSTILDSFGVKTYSYVFKLKDNIFVKQNSVENISDSDFCNMYFLQFTLTESETVSVIRAGDYEYVYNMK